MRYRKQDSIFTANIYIQQWSKLKLTVIFCSSCTPLYMFLPHPVSHVLSGNQRQNGIRREKDKYLESAQPWAQLWLEEVGWARAWKMVVKVWAHAQSRERASMTTSHVQELSGSPDGQNHNNNTQIEITWRMCAYIKIGHLQVIFRKLTCAPLNKFVHAYCNLYYKRDGESVSIILQTGTSSIMY